MIIKFLSENKVSDTKCLGEHGLSLLIESNGVKVLFDTGAGFALPHNINAMGVDPETIDFVVISHGHYDHTEGVQWFCNNNHKAKIYIHRNAFKPTFGFEKGKLEEVSCGIRWTQNEFDEIRHRLILTEGVTKISEELIISGTIPELVGYEPTEKFYYKDVEDNLIADSMDHEQFLMVRENDGYYLFSGCSHRGIIPALRYSKVLLPEDKLLGVIAGLHLFNATMETAGEVAEELKSEGVEMIMPVHCTGMNAICCFKEKFGHKCVIAGAGDVFEY